MSFPPASDLQFLLGKEVIRIAFEPSGVHFVWWEGGEIHAMQDFEHRDYDGVLRHFGNGSQDQPSLLHQLIQRKVTSLHVRDNLLSLVFDDGQELALHAEPGRGENGLIQLGPNLSDDYIVF